MFTDRIARRLGYVPARDVRREIGRVRSAVSAVAVVEREERAKLDERLADLEARATREPAGVSA